LHFYFNLYNAYNSRVDCGYSNFLLLLEQAANNMNIYFSKLTKVIITHHDYDHMGSAAEIKRKYPKVQIKKY